MTTATIDIGDLLYVKEGFREGRPCLRGTGITIHTVVAAHLTGLTADEIFADLPHLTLAGIHAALAYYYAHRAAVDADFEADVAWGDEQIRAQESEWDGSRTGR